MKKVINCLSYRSVRHKSSNKVISCDCAGKMLAFPQAIYNVVHSMEAHWSSTTDTSTPWLQFGL